MKRHNRSHINDEPSWDDCEEVEFNGGEAIFAVGHTSGGAPYGPTLKQLKESALRDNPQAGWARAKRAFVRAFQSCQDIEIGRVRKVGEGLSREAYATWIQSSSNKAISGSYVALLPGRDSNAEDDQPCRVEALLLEKLSSYKLPFEVPRNIALVPEMGRIVMVRDFAEGIPLDLRSGRQHLIKPWEVVASIASAIHGLPVKDFQDFLPGFPSKRAHGRIKLDKSFSAESTEPILRDAYQWASENLPEEQDSTLIHGDLLGQNILLSIEHNQPTIIDWESAFLGDPAYELAIVTRGVKKPFQLGNGLNLLLNSYRENGGVNIEPKEISFYEICLHTSWYFQLIKEQPLSGQIAAELSQIASILKRANAR